MVAGATALLVVLCALGFIIFTRVIRGITELTRAMIEIAGNIHRAAQGAQSVTGNIAGVGLAAESTGSASTRLMGLSDTLSERAGKLKSEVESFVRSLRSFLKTSRTGMSPSPPARRPHFTVVSIAFRSATARKYSMKFFGQLSTARFSPVAASWAAPFFS
jgi:hypothetical protein